MDFISGRDLIWCLENFEKQLIEHEVKRMLAEAKQWMNPLTPSPLYLCEKGPISTNAFFWGLTVWDLPYKKQKWVMFIFLFGINLAPIQDGWKTFPFWSKNFSSLRVHLVLITVSFLCTDNGSHDIITDKADTYWIHTIYLEF
jgi:hypothetical protein